MLQSSANKADKVDTGDIEGRSNVDAIHCRIHRLLSGFNFGIPTNVKGRAKVLRRGLNLRIRQVTTIKSKEGRDRRPASTRAFVQS